MNSAKCIVLDANILVRGVLGSRVLSLLRTYESSATFYTPSVCFIDARRHIEELSERRGLRVAAGLRTLDQLACIVQVVDQSLYEAHEISARMRISSRDAEDWPILAASLLLGCPIWTEDQDFFGCGVANWTTNNIEQYFGEV